jgi:HEAT repeat protein
MDEISNLITNIVTGGLEQESSTARLVALRGEIVPRILERIRQNPSDAGALEAILERLDSDDLVPPLIPALRADSFPVSLLAFRMLAYSAKVSAVPPLIELLEDQSVPTTRRSLAAIAIGELGDKIAIDPLKGVCHASLKTREPQLAIAAAEALCKLGHQGLAHVLIRYATNRADPTLRPPATRGLQVAVAPGVLSALRRAARDKYVEVRLLAVDGLFLLGAKWVVSDLIKTLADREPRVAMQARLRLGDLTGAKFDPDLKSAQFSTWWASQEGLYSDQICYRSSRPIDLTIVINDLKERNTQRRFLAELHVITGRDFLRVNSVKNARLRAPIERARVWWRNTKRSFVPGKLYKYGIPYDVTDVLDC